MVFACLTVWSLQPKGGDAAAVAGLTASVGMSGETNKTFN